MRTSLLLFTVALLAACSDDAAPPEPSAAAPTAPAAQAPAPAAEQADIASAEVTEPQEASEQASDPCDLSGYDMSKMTVELHENLVKACDRSKQ